MTTCFKIAVRVVDADATPHTADDCTVGIVATTAVRGSDWFHTADISRWLLEVFLLRDQPQGIHRLHRLLLDTYATIHCLIPVPPS
jgi:hypothetical protein